MFLTVHVFCATCREKAQATGPVRLGSPISVEVELPDGWEFGEAEAAFFCPYCKEKPARTTGEGKGQRVINWPGPTRHPVKLGGQTAVNFRVRRLGPGWWPVELGTIPLGSSEEDFIQKFLLYMPKQGDGKFQFTFTPINEKGEELPGLINVIIGEGHEVLVALRAQRGER